MNPSELANTIESLIIGASERFGTQIIKVQDRLYANVLVKLKEIELDTDGYILQNAHNRSVILDAEFIINQALTSGPYVAAVSQNLSIFSEIDSLNEKYFSSLSGSFKPNRLFLKSLQTQTFNTIESYLLQDGLRAQVQTPLTQILYQNVNSGGSFSGFLEQIRGFIKGTENEGRLLSYSRGLLRDTMFNYSRAYQQSVTEDLGLEFYLYAGGLVDTSRPFCIERNGNFYHFLEVESWADQSWKGQMAGTTKSSIFVFAGGYNCSHSIIPVSEVIVPKDVIQRNIKSGNYIP